MYCLSVSNEPGSRPFGANERRFRSTCLDFENASLEEIIRKGVACGAANTQVIGAGFIDPYLVRQSVSQVTIRQIRI